jgi:uncharacterized repeat protein (TIGR03803 family)
MRSERSPERMRFASIRTGFLVLIAVVGVVVFPLVASAQSAIHVLHAFVGGGADGSTPNTGLMQAADGNFYGTTNGGRPGDFGTTFKMTPGGTVTALHSFANTTTDGGFPYGPLIQATDGNFYGTTADGGSSFAGTVFKMTPSGTVTVLHAFAGRPNDGSFPNAGLIQATDGNLYGPTSGGGAFDLGTIFKVTLAGDATVVHSFTGSPGDGTNPRSALMQASDGNLYGTTFTGGVFNVGTVFKIDKTSGALVTLHSFNGGPATGGVFPFDGSFPTAALVQATDGSLYGTVIQGGASNAGTTFKVTPAGAFTLLHSFEVGTEGSFAYSPLVQAADGDFYGANAFGGPSSGGTLFKMTSTGAVTILHAFDGAASAPNGHYPKAGMIQDRVGSFYGMTEGGGAYGAGVVFGFKLNAQPFTDDPLVASSTLIKAVHFAELRTRVDGVRLGCGLLPYGWTAVLTTGTIVEAIDITSLRTALSQAYGACGLTLPSYPTDPDLSAGTSIKAAHLAEIRNALWSIE